MSFSNIELSEIKAWVADKIVSGLFGSGKTDPELELIKKDLLAKLTSSDMMSTIDSQYDVMDSSKLEKTMDNLYLDILTANRLTDVLDDVMSNQASLVRSFAANAETELDILSDKLDSLHETISSKLNPVYKIEGFRSSESFETNDRFYTDRFGETVNDEAHVKYDSSEQKINLPVTASINTLSGNDVVNAKVGVSKQIGGNFIKIRNANNEIENIIDVSGKTFWSETILSNDILRDVSVGDDYGINYGAICELEIKLESVRKINEITVSPYGEFPISLVAIRYTETDNPNEAKKEFADDYPIPQHSNDDASEEYPMYIESPKSFKFKDTVVKNIYVLFTQVHYVREHFAVGKSNVIKSDIWNKATSVDEKRVYDSQMLFNPLLDEEKSVIPKEVQAKINSLIIGSKNAINFEGLIKNDREIYLDKYAYSYGFYSIAANFKDYSNFGIYVSNPIKSIGNIKEIRIETDEFHPPAQSDGRDKLTDIEYYISYKENPLWEEWTPILPTNTSAVKCELLQLQNNVCNLRFNAVSVEGVYMYSRKLTKDIDYTLKTANGVVYGIYIPNYNFNAIYTASYTPTEESRVVKYDMINAPMQNTEKINGDSSNAYLLSNFPRASSPTTISITDLATGETLKQEDKQIMCVTNNLNPKESYKNFTKNSSMIQYYVHRNVLYFNRDIGTEKVIELDYYHYISNVRLKAILRRNSYDRWLTPVVNEIFYSFVTE